MKGQAMLWLLLACTAASHPMGNFSVSHYSGVTIERRSVELRYLLDLAEIPTFQEMQQSGITGPDDAHVSAYLASKSTELAVGLHLTLNGKILALRLVKQNGGVVMRLSGLFRRPLAGQIQAIGVGCVAF